MAKKAAASQMQSVRVSKRKRWILVGSGRAPHNLSHITPQPMDVPGNLTPLFLMSLTPKIIWAPNHDLPTHPTAIFPGNRRSIRWPFASSACFARKVEGLELDIAVCIARLGRNTKTGERFQSWKLFSFGEGLTCRGGRGFFLGAEVDGHVYIYTYIFIFLYIDMCV